MRIIAGDKKGLTLVPIKGNHIRPTTDKIRGAIFSSLTNYFPQINGFIDCFGGSGAMAIEAVSRGADNVFCFDKNIKSIRIIKQNLEKAHYLNKVQLFNLSALKGFKLLDEKSIKADVFFMDPPYKDIKLIYPLLEFIHNHDLLAQNGLIVIEHDKSDIIQLDNIYQTFNTKKYGSTVISYLEK